MEAAVTAQIDRFSVSQIAKALDYSRTYVRKKLMERLAAQPELRASVCPRAARGPAGALYTATFVREVFPNRRFDERRVLAEATLPEDVQSTLSRHKSFPPSILGVLGSREVDPMDFTDLARFLIRAPGELRIRAIAATFLVYEAPFKPIYQAFQARAAAHYDGPKILLLHPDAKAAKLRSLVEEGRRIRSVAETSMWQNAHQAFQFLQQKEAHWNLTVKWVHVAPSSFILHNSEAGALLEMYDLGKPPTATEDTTLCIGGRAPVLFIAPGTAYHATLQNGFDWLFEPPKYMAHCIKHETAADLARYFNRTRRAKPNKRIER
jgi:hypothetical protein